MDFDPLAYLNLHLDPAVKDIVSQKLLDLLSQYLIIRTIEILPEDEIANITDPKTLFDLAQQTVPDYNQRVKEFLAGFKKEYQDNQGIK